jgi:hypothetical protein|nr:MAG TPA: hypothetical protein [Caudoviricetes sp.]
MKKSEILEVAKSNKFELDKNAKDLHGNTFFSLKSVTTNLILIYRDHKDRNFFLMGVYPSEKANKLMENLRNRR